MAETDQKEATFIMLLRRVIIGFFILLGIFFIKTNIARISWMLVFVLSFWLLSTFPFEFFLRRIKNKESAENANFLYFIFECLMLTIGIHYIGGIYWIGGIFYSITIAFAHFMLPRRKAITITLVAVFIFFNWLSILEFFEIFKPNTLFVDLPPYSFSYFISTIFLTDFFLMFIAGVLGVFSTTLKEKEKEYRLLLDKVEEERMVLEIKVNARTREARSLASELETKVKERTGDLNKKIKEMEKFNKFTKGREEKLIELEKEAQRLKTLLVNKEKTK